MTVTAQEARVEYLGNGSTTAFSYPYLFFQADDLQVWITDAAGNGVLKILNSDYTVSGVLNPAGGAVTFMTAPLASETVILINSPDIQQPNHYVNADDFPAKSHENALDRLTKICQRLDDRIDRAVRAPDYTPENEVPDAGTLVGLVEDAQLAASNSAASAAASASSASEALSAQTIAQSAAAAASSSASDAAASAVAADVEKIVWRGPWSSATTYALHDAVETGGTSYISKTTNTNKPPAANPSDWDVLAAKGLDSTVPGPPGPQGAKGDKGDTGATGPAGTGAGDMLRSANLSDLIDKPASIVNLGAIAKAGDTMTGHLSLPANPAAANAVRKDYVDAGLSGKVDTSVLPLLAPLADPVFTGNPQAPTPLAADNDDTIATTKFVKDQNYAPTSSVPVAATAAEYVANSAPTKMLTPGAAWSAAAWIQATPAATTFTLDGSAAIDFWLSLTAVGMTMANPTNMKAGQKGIIALIQDATGGRTITTWGSNWKFPGGNKPVLTATANAYDILSYFWSGTTMYCTFNADFK